MLDVRRVKQMAGLTRLIGQERRRAMVICRFRRRDYLILQMLETFLCATAAYFLILMIWLLLETDAFSGVRIVVDAVLERRWLWLAVYVPYISLLLHLCRVRSGRRYDRARERLLQLSGYQKELSGEEMQ